MLKLLVVCTRWDTLFVIRITQYLWGSITLSNIVFYYPTLTVVTHFYAYFGRSIALGNHLEQSALVVLIELLPHSPSRTASR